MAWFIAIGASGIYGIVQAPGILAALNPLHALGFLTSHGAASFVVLGSVVLAVTGAEARYSAMGRVRQGAVLLARFSPVAPALGLYYIPQGALLIVRPAAVQKPSYLL